MAQLYSKNSQTTLQQLRTKFGLTAFLGLFLFASLLMTNQVTSTDTDGDGISNANDLDDDNDGLSDVEEGQCSNEVVTFDWDDHYANWGYEDPAGKTLSVGDFQLSIERIDPNGITEVSDIRDANGFYSSWYIQQDPTNTSHWGMYKLKFNMSVDPLSFTIGDVDYGVDSWRDTIVIEAWSGRDIYDLTPSDYSLNSTYSAYLGNNTFYGVASSYSEANITLTFPVAIDSVTIYYKDGIADGNFGVGGNQVIVISDFDLTCASRDSDKDGIIDGQDLDSDNDGIPDIIEAGGVDQDGDGMVDVDMRDPANDQDRDGFADLYDASCTTPAATYYVASTIAIGEVTNSSGVSGSSDLDYSTIDTDGSALVLDMGATLNTGTEISIILGREGGRCSNGGARKRKANYRIQQSTDNSFYSNTVQGTTSKKTETITYVLDSDARYIKVTRESSSLECKKNSATVSSTPNLIVESAYYQAGGDDCAGSAIPNPDTDGDGLNDYRDVDSDSDGIPDAIEGQPTFGYLAPSGQDANGNGIDDAYDPDRGGRLVFQPQDTDGDQIPDFQDTQSDTDDRSDFLEAYDADDSGDADILPSGSDRDGDGLDDNFDLVSLESSTWTTNASNGGQTALNPFPNDDTGQAGGEPDWRDGGVLPVEWIGFSVEWKQDQGYLSWETAQEQNSDHFFVERKMGEGGQFQAIGSTPAVGNSTGIESYQFWDPTALEAAQQGILYYRIQQVDVNGQSQYSSIQELRGNGQEEGLRMKIFPNPATDHLNIDLSGTPAGRVKMRIITIDGRTVHTEELVRQVHGVWTVPIQSWTAGRYIVVVENEASHKSLPLTVK